MTQEEYPMYPHRPIPDFLPTKTCCETMHRQLRTNAECKQHGYNCPDRGISYRSDGIYLIRAPNANYSIDFCPWCGTKLAEEPNEGARMLDFDPRSTGA